VLVLGSNGQVGHELRRTLAPLGDLVCLERADVDLRDSAVLRGVVLEHRPHAIVNAAAYTAVDRAETDEAAAFDVNATAPAALAEVAESIGACLVHYSTDYVFDGRSLEPYREEDAPNPASVYGKSKLAGERAIAGACARHAIFRTSWVFGAHGSNFLKTILRLASDRDELRVVSDQWGAPTSAGLIAEVTAAYLRRRLDDEPNAPGWGLYHLAAAGSVSWDGYARFIVANARAAGCALRLTEESIQPITTADYAAPAPRPANSRLDTSKLRLALGLELPEWQRDVERVTRFLCTPHST
jgi:dTDP-4-dehydrorhamnose reductase